VSSLGRGKKDVSSRGGSACGHAIKGAAKGMKEESGVCLMTKGIGVLWEGHS